MVNEREELQRILTELKGLLDEVLRVASDVTDEQIPPTRLIAIGLNVDDRPIVDNLPTCCEGSISPRPIPGLGRCRLIAQRAVKTRQQPANTAH
jgi:hypothetical protein